MNFGQRWLRRWCVQLFRAPTHPPVHSALLASTVLPVTLAAALWFWREFIRLIKDLHIYMAVVMENRNIYIYETISVNYNFEERWKWAGLDSNLRLCANKLKTLPLGQTVLHNHTQRHVNGSIWLFCGIPAWVIKLLELDFYSLFFWKRLLQMLECDASARPWEWLIFRRLIPVYQAYFWYFFSKHAISDLEAFCLWPACSQNQARSYMPDPTFCIWFSSIFSKKTWIILCKTNTDSIRMAWSGFGQMHVVWKQASVQESLGLVYGRIQLACYQSSTFRLNCILPQMSQIISCKTSPDLI